MDMLSAYGGVFHIISDKSYTSGCPLLCLFKKQFRIIKKLLFIIGDEIDKKRELVSKEDMDESIQDNSLEYFHNQSVNLGRRKHDPLFFREIKGYDYDCT